MITKECRIHGLTEFAGWKRSKSNRGVNPHCIKCERERAVRRRSQMKIISDELKLKYGCLNCGYNAYACGLEWAHIDSSQKKLSIGNASCLSSFLKELPKYVLLCGTCHLEYDNGVLSLEKESPIGEEEIERIKIGGAVNP